MLRLSRSVRTHRVCRQLLALLTLVGVLAALTPTVGCQDLPQLSEQVKATPPPPPPAPPPSAEPPPPEPTKDYWSQLPPGENALVKVTDPNMIPDYRAGFDDRDSLLTAVRHSINYLAAHPSSQLYFPSNGIGHAHNLESLRVFEWVLTNSANADEFAGRVRQWFDTYVSVGCDRHGTVLFTAYYRPIFEASRTATPEFRYPLYKPPADLVIDKRPGPSLGTPLGRRLPDGRVVPYFTRAELDGGPHLRNHGLELVWLRDRFDAFIIHVQGSALLRLTDGAWMTIGYAGKTDRPYGSVSEALIRDGRIRREERSLQTLRRYFREHPEDLDRYLPVNQCYVFFKETRGGPFGSLGVPVTDLRTIATDKTIYPRAGLAFVQTQIPGAGGAGRFPLQRFALDQDTGGAIRAAGRCDLFLGTGPEAEKVAGHTFSEGRLFYLFLKEDYLRSRGVPMTPTAPPTGLPPSGPPRAAPEPASPVQPVGTPARAAR